METMSSFDLPDQKQTPRDANSRRAAGSAAIDRARQCGPRADSETFPSPFHHIKCRGWSVVAVIVWVLGIGFGLRYQAQYDFLPAATKPAADRWPVESQCRLSADHPTLVVFIHPRCGCTRASLTELAKLMSVCHGRLETQLVFLMPSSVDVEWSNTDLWSRATRIPGVVCRLDSEGIEHELFHASASGELFLYRPNGDLVMHGGMTPSRGQSGDNRGRKAIEQFVLHNIEPAGRTHVFGCELESAKSKVSKLETLIGKEMNR
jgi:hypothetical protein